MPSTSRPMMRVWISVVPSGIMPPRVSRKMRSIGVPTQAYLAWVFERLGTHRDVFGLELEAVTPAAFKRSLA